MTLVAISPAEHQDTSALGERARRIASQISQLDAELVEVVQRLEDCAEGLVGMTVRQYVGWQAGFTPAEAARLCTLARRLRTLPRVRDELRSGRMSAGTASTLAAVATPDNEAALIETAMYATGGQLQTLLRAYRQNIEHDRERPPPTDSVRYGINGDRWRMRADLSPERGAQVEAALRAEKETAIADAGSSNDDEGMLSTDADVSNAAALVAMAQAVVGGTVRRDGIVPERFQVILHVQGGDDGAEIQGGAHIEQPSITEFVCESWITVVCKRNGQPATITSPTRLATPMQQRALLARDRTCRFPGCGRSFYLKAHHIVFYENGGPTQLDNLVLLCQVHHMLIHKPGWRLRRDPSGRFWFTAPDGRLVLPQRRPVPGRPPPPAARPPASYDPLTAWGASVTLESWLN